MNTQKENIRTQEVQKTTIERARELANSKTVQAVLMAIALAAMTACSDDEGSTQGPSIPTAGPAGSPNTGNPSTPDYNDNYSGDYSINSSTTSRLRNLEARVQKAREIVTQCPELVVDRYIGADECFGWPNGYVVSDLAECRDNNYHYGYAGAGFLPGSNLEILQVVDADGDVTKLCTSGNADIQIFEENNVDSCGFIENNADNVQVVYVVANENGQAVCELVDAEDRGNQGIVPVSSSFGYCDGPFWTSVQATILGSVDDLTY